MTQKMNKPTEYLTPEELQKTEFGQRLAQSKKMKRLAEASLPAMEDRGIDPNRGPADYRLETTNPDQFKAIESLADLANSKAIQAALHTRERVALHKLRGFYPDEACFQRDFETAKRKLRDEINTEIDRLENALELAKDVATWL
jgi:hypothetical protein